MKYELWGKGKAFRAFTIFPIYGKLGIKYWRGISVYPLSNINYSKLSASMYSEGAYERIYDPMTKENAKNKINKWRILWKKEGFNKMGIIDSGGV